jgi:5-methylcytosine-specific restriction enzyme subunit McrC
MQRHLVTLTEWQTGEAILSADDAFTLASGPGEMRVARLDSGKYRVEPSHWIGTVALSHADVIVQPKVGVERLFHLLSYSPRLRFRDFAVPLDDDPGVTEAIVRAFLMQVVVALRRSPLMAYRGFEDALPTVRGRVRLLDQARRRFNFLVPVEVSFDEFTADIDENRVLKAALRRIERIRLRDSSLRRRVGANLEALETVADIRYDARTVPDIHFTRMNRHYEPAIVLAKPIIVSATPEMRHGETRTPSFMLDMDKVFEDFIFRALQDQLSVGAMRWRQGRRTWLDSDSRVRINPDLTLWKGSKCRFVGDVKYKRTDRGENEDLYQVVAYGKALGQKDVLLVYAEAGLGLAHTVRHDGMRVHVRGIDLSTTVDELDAQICDLARTVERFAGLGAGVSAAA